MSSEYGNTETTHFNAVPPASQESVKERNKVKAGAELLNELIERLTDRATFYDTLSSIKADVETTPEKHLLQCIANDQTKANLLEELEYWKSLRNSHL